MVHFQLDLRKFDCRTSWGEKAGEGLARGEGKRGVGCGLSALSHPFSILYSWAEGWTFMLISDIGNARRILIDSVKTVI